MADAVLNVANLSKSFGALKATDDVTIDLRPGEIHALIGPNGAGKSTLIAQIAGSLRPDAGSVAFGGRDITALSVAQRARLGLARTFQISSLASEDTVRENIALGLLGAGGDAYRFFRPVMRRRAIREAADDVLSRVGLIEFADTRVSELSHGLRRLLEVGLALTLSPRAFIMDEPMAGLGVDGSKEMTAFLDGLRNEAPILLVEHDMDAVFALADRISVLVYGRIIATGTAADIRANPEVQRAYLGEDAA